MVENAIGNAPQQQALEPTQAATAQYNQFRSPVFGDMEDGVHRMPDLELPFIKTWQGDP